jgi:hypothetical protein
VGSLSAASIAHFRKQKQRKLAPSVYNIFIDRNFPSGRWILICARKQSAHVKRKRVRKMVDGSTRVREWSMVGS